MSNENPKQEHTEHPGTKSVPRPSTEGRSAADVWREESKIVPVE